MMIKLSYFQQMLFSHLFDVSIVFAYLLLCFSIETKFYFSKYLCCLPSETAEETFSNENLNTFIIGHEDPASTHASKYYCNTLEAHTAQNEKSGEWMRKIHFLGQLGTYLRQSCMGWQCIVVLSMAVSIAKQITSPIHCKGSMRTHFHGPGSSPFA